MMGPDGKSYEITMDGQINAPWNYDIIFIEQKGRYQWLGFWLALVINLGCFVF